MSVKGAACAEPMSLRRTIRPDQTTSPDEARARTAGVDARRSSRRKGYTSRASRPAANVRCSAAPPERM